MCQKGTHLDSLASFGVVLSKAVSNCKAGRLFTPEEGGGTAAGLFRYSSVINWFRPPAGQPPGHHEGRGVLRPIGDALGVVLAAILLVWAVLYVTKGRFLKSPAERNPTRLPGSRVTVPADVPVLFNPIHTNY